MSKRLAVGDNVRVNDSSYSIETTGSKQVLSSVIDNLFTVVGLTISGINEVFKHVGGGYDVHDILIQDTVTKCVYLHTSHYVSKVDVCRCCGAIKS